MTMGNHIEVSTPGSTSSGHQTTESQWWGDHGSERTLRPVRAENADVDRAAMQRCDGGI